MRFFLFILSTSLLIVSYCSQVEENGMILHEIKLYLMKGSYQIQQEGMPLFPGETSIQYIEEVLKNVEDVKKQLKRTFGYHQIEFEGVNGVPLYLQKKEQTFLLRFFPDYYFRLIIFRESNDKSIPIHVTAMRLHEEHNRDDEGRRDRILNNFTETDSLIFSVRANVPLRQGLILGRALSDDSGKALFVIIQPLQSHLVKADQFYDLENRYKNLNLTYGKENLNNFRMLAAKRLGIESLAPYREGEKRIEREKNVVEYEKLDAPPEILKRSVPEYPENDRKAGVEGLAVILILVDETGKVLETEIKKSTGSGSLDSAAVGAASAFEFRPAKKNNKAVKFKMNIPFRFRLKK